jgi:hypothetical protein
MLTAALFVLSLAVAAEGNTPAPAKNYTLTFEGTTKELQANKKGELKMCIKATEGYHVSAEAPLKIALESQGVDLAKKQLGRADAKDKKSEAPEFAVSFGAGTAGDKSIVVDASFFVCNEKICEKKTEKVSVAVAVKP